MGKSVEATQHEFGSVRTGRASPALLDRIVVDYYGAPTPLKQLATISAPEARLLTVQPYDKTSIKAIEKAINESDVGLNPSNDGNMIRLVDPGADRGAPQGARQGRAAHRRGGARRDPQRAPRHACTTCASCSDEGEVGADDEHRAEAELQKLTDARIARARRHPQGQGSRDPRGLTGSAGPARARYVAIITDGNGRWAQARGLPVAEGHGPAPTPSRRACATRSSSACAS